MPGMVQDDGMKCPRCQSDKIIKNGRKNGKQRFICKVCRRQFLESQSPRGYDEAFKTICLQAYQNGKSFREIERVYDVHHTTVMSWVKQAGYDLSDLAKATPRKLSSTFFDTEKRRILQPAHGYHTQTDIAEVRERILSSALRLFTKVGYDLIRMEQVAVVSDVSLQTLNIYFADKESLFSALIRSLLSETYRTLPRFSVYEGDDTSPEVALNQVAIALLTTFSENQTFIALIRLLIGESGRFPDLAKRFVSEVEKPILEQISMYLKFHPKVRIANPPVTARIFVGALMHHALVQNVLKGKDILPLERDRLVDDLIANLIMR